MTKVMVKVMKHKNNTSLGGKNYTRFQCELADGSLKWLSCFEEEHIKALKGMEGHNAEIEMVEMPNKSNPQFPYYNIRGVYEEDSDPHAKILPNKDRIVETIEKVEVPKVEVKPINDSRTTTMYTSYAKDVFIALIGDAEATKLNCADLMEDAIELVEQARDAFS